MTRRSFLPTAVGTAALGAQTTTPGSRVAIEITYYRLRNKPDNQRQRLTEFLERNYVPQMRRAGAGPIGAFASSIGPDGPFLMLVTQHASLAAFEQERERLISNEEYMRALDTFNTQMPVPYERAERMLLRAFAGMPQIEVPPAGAIRPARVFEVRMYESNNLSTLRRKVDMFNKGEIAIFKKLGMQPVFFGEMVVGPKLPNLVYMLSFDDLAARDKSWRAFGADPDWKKMRETPGWADADIVSNITNFIVSPLPFSDVR